MKTTYHTILTTLESLTFMPSTLYPLILEYLSSDELTTIIEEVDRVLPLLEREEEFEEFRKILEKYLKVMNKYKKTSIVDRISGEMQLRSFFENTSNFELHQDEGVNNITNITEYSWIDYKHFIYNSSHLGKMVECLIGNSRLLGNTDRLSPHNLIQQIRKHSYSELQLQCLKIIYRSLSFIGLIAIVMDSGITLSLILNSTASIIDRYKGESDQRNLIFNELDRRMGNRFQTTYGLNKSSAMGVWKTRYFMFAVTPSQFKVMQQYCDSKYPSTEYFSRLKSDIVKLLNEYSLLQKTEQLQMIEEKKYDEHAMAAAENLSLVVNDCKSFKVLKNLINEAFSKTSLIHLSFKDTAIQIKDLIDNLDRSPYYLDQLKDDLLEYTEITQLSQGIPIKI